VTLAIDEQDYATVIGLYAIRGAVAATFNLEPVAALDVDMLFSTL
jgi:hypothetical protein